MSHDTDARCACVSEHRPPVLEYQRHHVWPLYLGGPDTEDNLLWLCPSTHANVHELIRQMFKAGRLLTYGECQDAQERPVSRYAHALAVRGLLTVYP